MASNEDRVGGSASTNEHIDPERLCDAAEAALKAVAEVSERNGGRWIYPLDIMSNPLRPACLKGFTTEEIDQASRFLVRMGIIEPRRAPRKAA
jgi:hypothetical protein